MISTAGSAAAAKALLFLIVFLLLTVQGRDILFSSSLQSMVVVVVLPAVTAFHPTLSFLPTTTTTRRHYHHDNAVAPLTRRSVLSRSSGSTTPPASIPPSPLLQPVNSNNNNNNDPNCYGFSQERKKRKGDNDGNKGVEDCLSNDDKKGVTDDQQQRDDNNDDDNGSNDNLPWNNVLFGRLQGIKKKNKTTKINNSNSNNNVYWNPGLAFDPVSSSSSLSSRSSTVVKKELFVMDNATRTTTDRTNENSNNDDAVRSRRHRQRQRQQRQKQRQQQRSKKVDTRAKTTRRSRRSALMMDDSGAGGGGDPSSASPVCRVVTRSDRKLSVSLVSSVLLQQQQQQQSSPAVPAGPLNVLETMDDIFHVVTHRKTRQVLVPYMRRHRSGSGATVEGAVAPGAVLVAARDEVRKRQQGPFQKQKETQKQQQQHQQHTAEVNNQETEENDDDDDAAFISTVTRLLHDAGYQQLSRRDLDLCEALNTEYLLRLSILPDVSELDPNIASDFDAAVQQQQQQQQHEQDHDTNDDLLQQQQQQQHLFDGRVVVFWRGYSQEVSKGRLLLPKIDYLQASVVQRSAAWVRRRLVAVERRICVSVKLQTRKTNRRVSSTVQSLIDQCPSDRVAQTLTDVLLPTPTKERNNSNKKNKNSKSLLQAAAAAAAASKDNRFFKLGRYGGSKIRFVGSPNPTDALNPFLICEDAGGEPSSSASSSASGRMYGNDNDNDNDYSTTRNSSSLSLLSGNSNSDGGDTASGGATASSTTRNIDRDMYACLNSGQIQCPYDAAAAAAAASSSAAGKRGLGGDNTLPAPATPMQLLQRVTIGNLVDLFSRGGRRKLLRTIVSKSELVEPTYEEVVVIWRPAQQELQQKKKKKKSPLLSLFQLPSYTPPKVVYELADMFDIHWLPDNRPEQQHNKQQKKKSSSTACVELSSTEEPSSSSSSSSPSSSFTTTTRPPVEIRSYENVPMANLPAVMPETKLVFRPADALVFDLVSLSTFFLALGSVKFDNPRLDVLAVISVSLWLFRTFLRYSNKLARYDLTVKKFVSSRISHRNDGAVQYLAQQAARQRAARAAIVHSWLSTNNSSSSSSSSTSQPCRMYTEGMASDAGSGGNMTTMMPTRELTQPPGGDNDDDDDVDKRMTMTMTQDPLPGRTEILRDGERDINDMIAGTSRNGSDNDCRQIPIDVDAALRDLEILGLVQSSAAASASAAARNHRIHHKGKDSDREDDNDNDNDHEGQRRGRILHITKHPRQVTARLKQVWNDIFQG